MSVGAYLLGVFFLTICLVSIAVAARCVRRWLVPDWQFPDTALVDAVTFLAILLGLCELLGTVGLFRFWFVLGGSVLVGAATFAVGQTRGRRRPASVEVPVEVPVERVESPPDPFASIIGIGIAAVVAGMWLAHTSASLRGIRGFDSVNYHLPFAVRFLQTGHTLPLTYARPGDETAFDPLNAELLVAFFMMPFHRDVVVPLLNTGWATLALLAAWCIGRTRGVGELTLAGASVILVTPLMIGTNAGQATNDIVVIALLLSSVALLMRSRGRLALVGVAGGAAGLGLGAKLTVVIPLLVLTIGLVLIAGRGRRFRTALAWLGPAAVTGGYWYMRNLVAIGNPVPTVHVGLGPLALPSPTFSHIDQFGFTVAHYLTDSQVIHQYLLPGLTNALGHFWPLTIVFAVSGMVLALFDPDRLTKVFGVMAIVAFVGYVITPTSAAGPAGHPILFSYNSRYVYAALAVGLVLISLYLAPLLTQTARRWLLFDIVLAMVIEQLAKGALLLRVTLAVGLVLSLVLAISTVGRRYTGRRQLLYRVARTAVVVALVGGAISGYFIQRQYLDRRYVNAGYAAAVNHVFIWARGISHARIAADGLDETYPLNGLDLSNYVEPVGVHGVSGSFERVTSCAEWHHEIARGRYDYIVTVVGRDAAWSRGPSAKEEIHIGSLAVFKVVSPFRANPCPSRKAPRPRSRNG